MKYPTINLIYDRKKQSSDKKEGYIEIRVTFDRKQKYYSTGVKVLPSQINGEKHVINHPDTILLNSKIDSLYSSIKAYITSIALNKEPFSFLAMQAYMDKSKMGESFVRFAEETIDNRADITESTRKNHRRLISALNEMKVIDTFADLTRENIEEFDRLLHKRNYQQTTIYTYHKFMKVYISEAMKRNLIEKNPYIGFRLDKGKHRTRKYLTEEELSGIIDCKITTDTLNKVKDVFLFQCYTGLAYAELENFNPDMIVERNNRKIYVSDRKKTGESFYIVILPKAMEILNKYDNKLPLLSNQKYNANLKTLAVASGIRQDLTSHMARHTFAVVALNEGIPIETVSKMMGHTNIKTTQEYAKIINKTVEKAFDKLDK